VREEFTVDELAQRAGTRTSTVRLYQNRGLLPPPEVRGRVGYYSPAHLARLRIIDRLQARGFSLAAIKDLLDNWSRGASLADILGADQELASLGQPVTMEVADFAALFPDGDLDPDVVQRAADLGLFSYDAQQHVIRTPSRAFLEIGRELAGYRVPPARALDEFEQLDADARRIAERFVALFEQYVDEPGAVGKFVELATAAVQELVGRALTDIAADKLIAATEPPRPDTPPRRS
jgi:DNA-binding transcriptional MerR regulator